MQLITTVSSTNDDLTPFHVLHFLPFAYCSHFIIQWFLLLLALKYVVVIVAECEVASTNKRFAITITTVC